MAYGLSIINNDNYTLIDDNYTTYVVESVSYVTSSYVSGAGNVLYIPASKRFFDGTVYAIRKVSDANNTINNSLDGAVYDLNIWDGRFILHSAGTYEILTLVKMSSTTTPLNSSNYGMEVFSGNGEKTFSSNYPLFRVTHVFSIPLNGASPSSGQWTFDYPQMPFNKPIYYMHDGRDAFMKQSGVYWYYLPTGLLTNSTQTKITMKRSAVVDKSPGTSTVFRTRIGVMV